MADVSELKGAVVVCGTRRFSPIGFLFVQQIVYRWPLRSPGPGVLRASLGVELVAMLNSNCDCLSPSKLAKPEAIARVLL